MCSPFFGLVFYSTCFFGSHHGFLNNFPRACQKKQLRNIVLAPSSRKTRKRSGCLELPKVARNRHSWSIRSCQGHVYVQEGKGWWNSMKFLHFRKLSRPWIFTKYKTLCLVGGHPSIFLGDELMELGTPDLVQTSYNLGNLGPKTNLHCQEFNGWWNVVTQILWQKSWLQVHSDESLCVLENSFWEF